MSENEKLVFGATREQIIQIYEENNQFCDGSLNHSNHKKDETFLDFVEHGCVNLNSEITHHLSKTLK